MSQVISILTQLIGSFGYLGIFLLMGLESSFFPFPSEVIMIPAGYLASQREMHLLFAIVMGILGSLAGSLLNYYLAYKFGRSFLLKYGRFFFFTPKTLKKMEDFFYKHGEIGTFVGRLIPGVRQYISLPAGLAKMNLLRFCLFTTLGASIWVIILALFGYYLGIFLQNHSLEDILLIFQAKNLNQEYLKIHQQLRTITILLLVFVLCCVGFYIFYQIRRKK
ncbi:MULTISPECIES: DedA family protein [unclassified Helicobacter]|uniref:DedA family protein n=1 Tax=unclassified Helicobacter TaxID=2593540 RepID=UPI001F2D61F0|nr:MULTISPECIES: DedA family protein [unclassified Helicobacter]